MELIDAKEWCCDCSDVTADKVLVDDPCGEQELKRSEERKKPRARFHFNENGNRQCVLSNQHTLPHHFSAM